MTINKLHVEEFGDQQGPPVLMLHGFMSSNLQWDPNRAGLGAKLRLLMTEQPGHGRSPGPDDVEAYRTDAVLDQIDRIRTDRGIDRWWMIGQSLGGAIAIRYAIRHPDRVAGLVFTNSRAVFGLTGRVAGDESETGSNQQAATKPDRPPGRDNRPEDVLRERIRAMPYHPNNAKRLPAELQARMIEAADRMPVSVFRHLRSAGPWASTDDLHLLRTPTLLINGRYEKAFQPCVDLARSSIGDLRVIDLEGGHSVNIDQPDAFNRAVIDFICG